MKYQITIKDNPLATHLRWVTGNAANAAFSSQQKIQFRKNQLLRLREYVNGNMVWLETQFIKIGIKT